MEEHDDRGPCCATMGRPADIRMYSAVNIARSSAPLPLPPPITLLTHLPIRSHTLIFIFIVFFSLPFRDSQQAMVESDGRQVTVDRRRSTVDH